MQCSPIRYSANAPPQAIIMVMLKDTIHTSPHAKVQFSTPSGEVRKAEMRLPVFINKFTEPVDMPLEAFNKFWDDITHNRPTSY